MEKDCRLDVIKRLEQVLVVNSVKDISVISNSLLIILSDYDVQQKSTELVIYEGENDKLLKSYASCLAVEGKQPRTIKEYVSVLRRVGQTLNVPFKEMTTYDLRLYFSMRMSSGLQNTSVDNERQYLSAFFKWMFNEGLITKNPCATIKKIKCPEKEKKPYSDVEIELLRSACKSVKHRAIIEFLLSSGVRLEECSNMDISDVDLRSLTVTVRDGKGGKDRTTYINAVTAYWLEKYLSSRNEEGQALFYGNKCERISKRGIGDICQTLGKCAEVDHVHPHRFRRTLATKLYERGMPIQEIQLILGHKNITTTTGYISISKSRLENSYRRHIA